MAKQRNIYMAFNSKGEDMNMQEEFPEEKRKCFAQVTSFVDYKHINVNGVDYPLRREKEVLIIWVSYWVICEKEIPKLKDGEVLQSIDLKDYGYSVFNE